MAVSLAPYGRRRSFPVVTMGPTEILLSGTVSALVGGASLVFDSIRVERLAIAPENRRWAMDFIKGPQPDTVVSRIDSVAPPKLARP
jgi:hypothetical protein